MLRSLASSTVLLLMALHSLNGQELKVADLGECELVSGEVIRDCRLGYRTVGTVAPDSSNVVLFPTAFTATSKGVLDLFAPGGLIDTSEYLVVVVDAFGNGVSSSPSNSTTQGHSEFPRVAIRDMVRHQHRLLTEHLGVSHLKAVVGFSMGGMQAFEWAVSYPGFAEKIVSISGSPQLAVYDIVLWETEVRTLEWFLDCECQAAAEVWWGLWFLFLVGGPDYHAQQSPRRRLAEIRAQFEEASLTEDMAYDLTTQLHAMIGHDVAAQYGGSLEQAASQVQSEVFVVHSLYDHVVTPAPALEFARLLNAATLESASDCGHDVLWCEADSINSAVGEFLRQ